MAVDLLASWSALYAHHGVVRTAVAFLHVGGLVAGGGIALAADRATLLVARQDALARRGQLPFLASAHRVVILGLCAVVLSGLFLFGADVDTFLHSKLFWTKMACTGLLLANGLLLRQAERRAGQGDDAAWTRLTWTAVASVALWTLTTLAGVALPNLG